MYFQRKPFKIAFNLFGWRFLYERCGYIGWKKNILQYYPLNNYEHDKHKVFVF